MSDMSAQVALRIERRWAALSIGIIAILTAVAVFAGLHQAVMPQSRVEVVDPTTLHISGEFTEDNLGTTIEASGAVIVRAVGQQYSFTPPCMVVPAGMPATIRATSSDVVHGFLIQHTNINTMLVPGYVSVIHIRFEQLGDYAMPCHEFCGVGHEGMWARVRVIDSAAFRSMVATRPRVSCAE